jgi:hypothetical protein
MMQLIQQEIFFKWPDEVRKEGIVILGQDFEQIEICSEESTGNAHKNTDFFQSNSKYLKEL